MFIARRVLRPRSQRRAAPTGGVSFERPRRTWVCGFPPLSPGFWDVHCQASPAASIAAQGSSYRSGVVLETCAVPVLVGFYHYHRGFGMFIARRVLRPRSQRKAAPTGRGSFWKPAPYLRLWVSTTIAGGLGCSLPGESCGLDRSTRQLLQVGCRLEASAEPVGAALRCDRVRRTRLAIRWVGQRTSRGNSGIKASRRPTRTACCPPRNAQHPYPWI